LSEGGRTVSRVTRDTHRAAAYAAEDQLARLLDHAGAGAAVEFFGSTLTLPAERRLADLASAQRYADAVLALPGVQARWPGVPGVRVRARGGSRRAHYEAAGAVVALPTERADGRWAGRETVVLHELAHHLTCHTPAARAEASHGPTFTAVLCLLLELALAPEAAVLLRASYDGTGVPVGLAPTPIPSEGE
jgi:putative metallohydrolase (TIGR04338 family)